MDHYYNFLARNQKKARTGEMKKLIDLLDEAGIPYETRVNILGGTGLRYSGPEQAEGFGADIISDGYGREEGLLECQGLGWDCVGNLHAEEIFEAIKKDFIEKGGTIRPDTMLQIYDWQKKRKITGIDLAHLEDIARIQIDVLTGDEIAVITYKDGTQKIIDSVSPGERTNVFYDGSAIIYDEAMNISLIKDGKLPRPLIIEKLEDHYEEEQKPEEEMNKMEKKLSAFSNPANDLKNSDNPDLDALLDWMREYIGLNDSEDDDDDSLPFA